MGCFLKTAASVVLLTDGLENAGDAVLKADALGQRGITVDVVHGNCTGQ